MTDYSLLTQVVDARHLRILDDWLEFLAVSPRELLIVASDALELQTAVEAFAATRGLRCRIVQTASLAEIRDEETTLLHQQFSQVGTEYALVIRLDTFPFRSGHDEWLSDLAQQMNSSSAPFLTGATMKYRSDKATDIPHVKKTQRVSNNFLLVRPERWLAIQSEVAQKPHRFGRFATEGLLETYCQSQDVWGLRRENTLDWRIFHTQVWDERSEEVRRVFRAGGATIKPFLNGYEEDAIHPWQRYFMYPRPSVLRRIRIAAGAMRSRIMRRS